MHKLKWIVSMILLFSVITFTIPTKAASSSHIVNPMQVYSYVKMVSDIKKLKAAYPDIMNVHVIGKSEYGRDIYAISVGKGPANLLINGSHHAREWLTTNLNMYMANRYAEAYIKNQKIDGYNVRSILSSSTIWFVPMVNPDGVTLQQQGPRAFPKNIRASLIKMNDGSMNFKRWKANAKGIDLNRQYPAGWSNLHGPNHPSYANYKGKAPETAAETKALVKFVDQINPEMAVSYHSSGKILYWNYKQDKQRYARDYVYANKIRQMTGYSLVYVGPHPKGGGGFTDWFVSVKKRPGFTPEIANMAYESNPPLSNFPKAWEENQAVGLYIAQEGTKLYQAKLLSTLQGKYQTLQNQANKLQFYYNKNISNESNLKIEKNFTNLFNSVKAENGRLSTQKLKLSSANQKKLDRSQSSIQLQLTNSDHFIKGIKAGESLLASQKAFLKPFQNGEINGDTVKWQEPFSKEILSTSKAIANMNGIQVQKLANQKYISPAVAAMNSTEPAVDSYHLIIQMEQLLQSKKTDGIPALLTNLEQFEKNPNLAKYPGVEKVLQQRTQAIKNQLDTLGISY